MESKSKVSTATLGQTQEQTKAVGKAKHSLVIGIPKETSFQENRVALTPLSVALLIEHGHQIVIESGAGEASNFMDFHYSEQGAQVVYDKEVVFKADIVIDRSETHAHGKLIP